MKIKTILLISIIFLVNNSVFSVESPNSKQIQAEKVFKQQFDEKILNIKSLPYKLIMVDELFMATVGNENSKCVGKEILMLKIKYQNNKESSNYKYSEKAYSLYLALLNEIANFKENLYYQSTDITNKKIIIPNALYDKLDTKLLNIITWLNVMADNI